MYWTIRERPIGLILTPAGRERFHNHLLPGFSWFQAADVKAPDPGIWSNPLGELGVEISIDGLATVLPFDAVVAADVGEPTPTFVSNPVRTGVVAMQVGFVYEHPDYGRLIIVESATGASQKDLVEAAEATPGCHTVTTAAGSEVWECVPNDFSVATIRGVWKLSLSRTSSCRPYLATTARWCE